jgi:hypothetical protein
MTLEDRLVDIDWTGALDIFRPASAISDEGGPWSRMALGPSVADLKESPIRLEWYEAIAIVQGACRAIIDSGDSVGRAIIESDSVVIASNGEIRVASTGPRSAPDAVRALGTILSETLPTSDFMLIRVKLVSRAISSPPAYASLEEFSRALAYFERPNRAALLKAVYDRWQQLPAAEPVPTAPVPVEEIPAAPRPAPRPFDERRARPPLTVAAAALLVAGLASAGVWAFMSHGPARPIESAPTPARVASAVQNADPVPADDPPAAHSSIFPRSRSGGARDRTRAGTRSRGSSGPAANRPDSEGPQVATSSAGLVAASATGSGRPSTSVRSRDPVPAHSAIDALVREAARSDPGGNPADVGFDANTYSADDAEVVAPVPVYPQSLVLVPDSNRSGVASIEVTINERGTVDAVKLQNDPRTIGEYLQTTSNLSAVKSWRFRPASKDGRAVRYRAVVMLGTR